MATVEPAEGWAFCVGSRKAHYFVDMMALCRKYGFYGGSIEPDNGKESPDDCLPCRKALKRQTGAAGGRA